MSLCNRKTLLISGLLFILVLITIVVVGLRKRSNYDVTIHDPSFHFTFCKTTSETNEICIGVPLLARLNRMLEKSGHRPVSGDRIDSFPLLAPTTRLVVGFRHDLVTNTPVTPVDFHLQSIAVSCHAEIIAGPDRQDLLRLAGPDRQILLGSTAVAASTKKHELVYIWALPNYVTNLSGCELRLSRPKDDKLVATIKFH